MGGIWGIHPAWGITAVRVAMALIFIVSGYLKWASGVSGMTAAFDKMGFAMPGIVGPFIGTLELVGGVLLLLGLFGRWLGLIYAIEFVVATFYVKFATVGWAGGRLDLMLLTGGILLFLAGPGKAAIDAVWLEKGRLVERTA
jgi:uncharacterized membrane protein YphA (DoxX/SURF4 family)